MAVEIVREDFGMTDKGQVVVVGKESYDDSGEKKVTTYEVRHGVHTVAEGISLFRARAIADAIAKQKEPDPKPEPEPVASTGGGGSGRSRAAIEDTWARF